MVISAGDLKNGLIFKLDNELFQVVEFLHVNPGKGGAFVRTKLKNLKTSRVIEKSFRAEEKIEDIRMIRKRMQFLYSADTHYYFMDSQTYEQFIIEEENLKEKAKFLTENLEVDILMYEGTPFSVELPFFVNLKVVKTEPGIKGDTVTGATKPAVFETGLQINVPLFINEGDIIKIDTRTSSYVERVG